jgi:rhomboid protease GluP
VLIGVNVAFYLWSLYVGKLSYPRIGYGSLLFQGPPFDGTLSSPLGLVGVYAHEGVLSGEWWRVVSAAFLHGGILHIGMNMYALNQLGTFAEQIFGPRRFLVVYVACGVCSMAAISIWNVGILGHAEAPYTVGASGAIFGVAGLLVGFLGRRGTERGRQIARSLAMNLLFMLALGYAVPIISNTGHVGGLIPGLVFGLFLRTGFAERLRPEGEAGWGGLALASCLLVAAGLSFAIANVFLHAPHFR